MVLSGCVFHDGDKFSDIDRLWAQTRIDLEFELTERPAVFRDALTYARELFGLSVFAIIEMM
jgi:hypothetical protein